LFAGVKLGSATSNFADFSTFANSFFTLFQITAGENWPAIMRDMSIEAPFCTEDPDDAAGANTDCGSALMARAYFYVYFLLTFCVFLNLYIATILDVFQSSATVSSLSKEDADCVRDEWLKVDSLGRGKIPLESVKRVMINVPAPFGFDWRDNYTTWISLREEIIESLYPGYHINLDRAFTEEIAKTSKSSRHVLDMAHEQGRAASEAVGGEAEGGCLRWLGCG